MGYDYKKCTSEIREFAAKINGAQMFSVGESVMEKKIYCVKYGKGGRKILANGAHHGLEQITAAFLMRFLREYAASVEGGTEMFGYDTNALYEKVGLYVIPMVNPDGVDIAINGLDITNKYHRRLISLVGIHSFNRVWQANANGVDINHNYDAHWSVVERMPGPTKYSGPYAESEPETRAVTEFVRGEGFDMLVAFHSQGREIYYDFDGIAAERDRAAADRMSRASGYPVCVPAGSAAFGGCKDWFVKEFGGGGFTIEMGSGKNPLPEKMLDDIFEENSKILLSAMSELCFD